FQAATALGLGLERPSRVRQTAAPVDVTGVSFQCYSTEEIRRLSVKEINRVETFDRLTGYRLDFGLYDPDLGPLDERDVCRKCSLGYWQCGGHFGHIELFSPVLHPMFFDLVFKLIRAKCFYCHRFAVKLDFRRLVRLQFLALGLSDESNPLLLADQLASIYAAHHSVREASANRKAQNDGEEFTGDIDEELVKEAESGARSTDIGCLDRLQVGRANTEALRQIQHL
uniref:DNA-directed RNA polymerase n=1 Tax=Macrostomum lignano TaxID=282301 RepID=A0A1I8G8W1_9PLAT